MHRGFCLRFGRWNSVAVQERLSDVVDQVFVRGRRNAALVLFGAIASAGGLSNISRCGRNLLAARAMTPNFKFCKQIVEIMNRFKDIFIINNTIYGNDDNGSAFARPAFPQRN